MFRRLVDSFTDVAALIAGFIMFLMMVIILVEIVARTFFHASTFVTYELVGYGLAALVFLGLGYAFRARGLVRMNLFISRLSIRQRRIVEILSALSTFALTVLLFAYFWLSVVRNYNRGSVSGSIAEIPLWIPEVPVLVGLFIFSLQLILYVYYLISVSKPEFLDPQGSDADPNSAQPATLPE